MKRESIQKNVEDLFDLRNFPISSKYCCSGNKKVVIKMKHEYGGKSVLKLVGLKSKMYSILDESSNEKSTNKDGNALTEFQEIHDTLFQKKILRNTMRGIQAQDHNLGTIQNEQNIYIMF